MKIVLIALPAPFADEPAMNPPLGLAYIAASLKAAGHDEIQAVDFATHDYNYDEHEWTSEIPQGADLYGISCMTVQYRWLAKACEHIRKNNKGAQIVVGGPHASSLPQDCLEVGADIAINGEGENAIVQIAEETPIAEVEGACYMDNGRFVKRQRATMSALDSLPFPDRDLFDMSRYKRKLDGERAVHIVTLRGCPYKCRYCDKKSVGARVMYRSVENVMEEIDLIRKSYDINSFVIYDDIFTLKRDRVEEFCKAFADRKLKWRCWARADAVDEKILTLMKESGLTSITLGIESGDDRVLRRILKRVTAADNERALLACKSVGVPVRCSLMYGNPGDDLISAENTVELIKKTQPDEWNLAILKPTPGSDMWERPQSSGLKFDKEKLKADGYASLNRFEDTGIGAPVVEIDSCTPNELLENIRYLVTQLEEVCPRKDIQGTIQKIDLSNLPEPEPEPPEDVDTEEKLGPGFTDEEDAKKEALEESEPEMCPECGVELHDGECPAWMSHEVKIASVDHDPDDEDMNYDPDEEEDSLDDEFDEE